MSNVPDFTSESARPRWAPKRRRGPLIPGGPFVLAGSALALFLLGSLWLAFFPPLPADLGGVTSLDAEARPVRIPVAEDDSVEGWYLAGREPGAVLLLHGHSRNHERMWRYGHFLHDAGYAVLAIDFRSSRDRDRKPTTLGHYELQDAQAALDWLRRRPEAKGRRIGVLGESLGGAVGLELAVSNRDVAAVIDDSAFENGRRAVEDAMGRSAGVPFLWRLAPMVCACGRVATGWNPAALDVAAAASRLHDRPLLFIHGADDKRISPEETRALWQAAGAKDSLWIVPGAAHNEGWITHREEYESRALRFFADHLGAAPVTHRTPVRATVRPRGGA